MLLKNLNLNTLLVFRSVYQNLSMTKTAQELGMTQPGVSQHIASLEEYLGTKLFKRVSKKLFPTKECDAFFDSINQSLNQVEKSVVDLSGGERLLSGQIRIGMPIEFGNNFIFPILSKLNQVMPNITFKINYGMAGKLNEFLADGTLDFAFVDDFVMDKSIVVNKVYEEELILCCSKKYFQSLGSLKNDKSFFESLNYIAYQNGAPVVKEWFSQAMKIKKLNLNVIVEAFDVRGVLSFVRSDMGVGVLPRHVIKRYLGNKTIHIFESLSGRVENNISMAYHPIKMDSPLVDYVYKFVQEELSKN